MLGAVFSLHSRSACFHLTTRREASLIFNVFTSDNNRTIIQISNLIFLSRKHFTSFESSLLCSSVSWQKSLLTNFLVRLSFLEFLKIFSLSLKFSKGQMIGLGWFILLSFFLAPLALSVIIFSSMSTFALKSFSISTLQLFQLSLSFSLIPTIPRLFFLERISKSTNLLWTYSASSWYLYIYGIWSSTCLVFSWQFWLFPVEHTQWILCSFEGHSFQFLWI